MDVDPEALKWLRSELISWYDEAGRSFTWRKADSLYKALIAEILLRRTWARQVAGVYEEVVERYPEPSDLASAETSEVEEMIKSLGLPRRAEELIQIGEILTSEYGGEVPKSRGELKELPGVGDYVAGAVLSIGENQKEWIVDTNVVRVFRRFFDLDLPNEARRSRTIVELAKRYADTDEPRRANLAILDHGSMVCEAKSPSCSECPLSSRCHYFNIGLNEEVKE